MSQILINEFDRKSGKFVGAHYLHKAAFLIRYEAPFHSMEFIRETLRNGHEILTPYSIYRKQEIPTMEPVMITCTRKFNGVTSIIPLDSAVDRLACSGTTYQNLTQSQIRIKLYNCERLETETYIYERAGSKIDWTKPIETLDGRPAHTMNMIDWTKPIETANGNLVKLISTDSGVKDYPNVIMFDDSVFLIDMNGKAKGDKVNLHPWIRNVEEKLTGVMYLNIYSQYKSAYCSRDLADAAAGDKRLACIRVEYTGKIGQFDE